MHSLWHSKSFLHGFNSLCGKKLDPSTRVNTALLEIMWFALNNFYMRKKEQVLIPAEKWPTVGKHMMEPRNLPGAPMQCFASPLSQSMRVIHLQKYPWLKEECERCPLCKDVAQKEFQFLSWWSMFHVRNVWTNESIPDDHEQTPTVRCGERQRESQEVSAKDVKRNSIIALASSTQTHCTCRDRDAQVGKEYHWSDMRASSWL